MYRKITGIDAYATPMLIAPAAHFTMGGLWVDYELMTTIEGLYACGECNFADHGANRLGANSLLQACVDGYFIVPSTIGNYLSTHIKEPLPSIESPEFDQAETAVNERINQLLDVKGSRTVDDFHRTLGHLLWDSCGISRSRESLSTGIQEIRDLREQFWKDVHITGQAAEPNTELEKALRVSDFLELGELMCHDALQREESCGAHFRTEYQTDEGEALRNDDDFCYVAAWQHTDREPVLHREPLSFEAVDVTSRNYK
jgi:succinate dehydrogenase / fumarate reductase flavoprotein subunit